jgi:hypothetical protein
MPHPRRHFRLVAVLGDHKGSFVAPANSVELMKQVATEEEMIQTEERGLWEPVQHWD